MRTYSPIPPWHGADAQTSERLTHTRLRVRMLEGRWLADLREHIVAMVGAERAAAWGPPSVIACPLRDLALAVSRLFDDPAEVTVDGQQVKELDDAMQAAGLWLALRRAQVRTEALNEALVCVSIDSAGRLSYRVVDPDLVDGEGTAADPGRPVWLHEWRVRDIGESGGAQWYRDEVDIRNPESPVYRVTDGAGRDVSKAALGGDFSGRAYPFRDAADRAVMPYVVMHADGWPVQLFAPFERLETVHGTMILANHAAFIDHAVRNAAWPQRFAFNAVPVGTMDHQGGAGEPPRRVVVADPATVLFLEPIAENTTALISQWSTSADVAAMQDVYERRLAMCAQSWGLSPSDLVRTGADPRSGVALALTSQAIREVQASRAPVYRGAVAEIVALSAMLLNRATNSKLPESGYAVRFALLPTTPQERSAQLDRAMQLFDRGLLSRVDAVAMALDIDATSAEAYVASAGPPPATPPRAVAPRATQPQTQTQESAPNV